MELIQTNKTNETNEINSTNTNKILKKRGRPQIHFEIKVKKCIGRPLGSVSEALRNRTVEEVGEIRRIKAKQYFENNPEQVQKSRESYNRYYERNKIEINRKRMEKKHGIKS